MAFGSGTRVGPYEIRSALGAGGMGEVWRARDTRLERDVAIKVLPAHLLTDADRLMRFRREARAASAVNHPHICTVHDVGEYEGAPYLVMELLEGETLFGRLRRGPLPPDEVIDVALDVASALEAAGARGIVHRDLKPANVFLTTAGGAKVLDFGLARMTEGTDDPPDAGSGAPTAAPRHGEPTRPHTVLGTISYMSPEQVRGELLDVRTDLFSFGVVLYEMATGRHPFAADNMALVVDGILNRTPASLAIESSGFPPALAGIISRALEKDLRLRYQTAADLHSELLRLRIRSAAAPTGVAGHAPAMPVPLTSFVGRSEELRLVRHALSSARLVTLTGPGGTGKTRLALQAASGLRSSYSDGVFFVPLTALRDPELVDSAIAQAVGLREVPDVAIAELLVRHLAEREILLVIDNCEHLLAAAPHVADLLLAAPRLSLLVTSRARLQVSVEVEVPVPPLGLPEHASETDVHAFAGSEAVALFCERAAAVKPGFSLNETNAKTVVEICARLDGLPLAIELAAARVRHLAPSALLSRLSHRLALLTGGPRDLPARQQTLRDAIGWSFDLLSVEERTLFARLAVFSGGFALEAAEAVSGAMGSLAIDVLDGVTSLVDKNLVRPREEGDEPRYTILETIREFGLERLAAGGEEQRARRAHAAYFASVATGTRDLLFSGQRVSHVTRITAELDNFRSALAWSVSEGGDASTGHVIAGELLYFWIMRNMLGEGRATLQMVLAQTSTASTRARAQVLGSVGVLHWLQGDHEPAHSCCEESLAICRAIGDERGMAQAMGYLALVEEARGRHAEARRLVTDGATLYRQLGDQRGLAFLLVNAIEPDDFAAARRDFEEALRVFRACGDSWNTSRAFRNLGVLALREGDLVESRRRFEDCLALQREIGDRWLISRTLAQLGDIDRCGGDFARAERCYEDSRAEEKILESRAHAAWSLAGLGHVALAQGHVDLAARLFAEGLSGGNVMVQKSEHAAACLVGLAEIRRLAGDDNGAALLLAVAEPLVAAAHGRMLPVDVDAFERATSGVRSALGDAAFDLARAEAERLGPVEIIRRGCQESGQRPEADPVA
ncbi:MAG: protein kinase [Acidobacteriota bacterium]